MSYGSAGDFTAVYYGWNTMHCSTPDINIGEVQKVIKEKGYNWTAGKTSMTLLPHEERESYLGGIAVDVSNETKATSQVLEGGALPESFDWRNYNGSNWITSVKDQQCGDCWAFSAIGALEPKVRISKNNPQYPVDLSEQQIKCKGHQDCTAWNLRGTYDFLKNTGTPYEACFPYEGQMGHCLDSDRCSCWDKAGLVKVTSYDFYGADTNRMKTDIMNKGPISVYMDVHADFWDYTGGVYQTTNPQVDGGHFVTIVGWNDGDNAWIVKNSWGPGWGEDTYGLSGEAGYFRIAYGDSAIGFNTIAINNISGPADDTSPVADALGPYSGLEGFAINFTGSAIDSDSGDCIVDYSGGPARTLNNQFGKPDPWPFSLHWDLDNNGIYETKGMTASLTWNDGYNGLVWLKVWDRLRN